MGRAIKLFLQNVDSYCDKCRNVLYAKLVVANAMFDIAAQTPTTHPVFMFKFMAEKMYDQIHRQFVSLFSLPVSSVDLIPNIFDVLCFALDTRVIGISFVAARPSATPSSDPDFVADRPLQVVANFHRQAFR